MFCDLIIETGKRRFFVHKCVVGVASEFFKRAITIETKEKFVSVNKVSPSTMGDDAKPHLW